MIEQHEVEIHLTPEEQDRRLMETTEQMRTERLAIEHQNVQLHSLVNQYVAVVEQLETELFAASASAANRAQLKDVLRQLSERSASVAASL